MQGASKQISRTSQNSRLELPEYLTEDLTLLNKIIFTPPTQLIPFVVKLGGSQVSNSPSIPLSLFSATIMRLSNKTVSSKRSAEVTDSVCEWLGISNMGNIELEKLHSKLCRKFGVSSTTSGESISGSGAPGILDAVRNKLLQHARYGGLREVARIMKEKTPLSHVVVCFQMLDFETSNSKI